MKPIATVQTNRVLTAPGCDPLPVELTDEGYASYWTASAEEAALLAAGVPLRLRWIGVGHPAVVLDVGEA